MKKLVMAVLVFVVSVAAGVAFSQEQPACIPPNLSCPQCIVTCPEIPACPACPEVTLNCSPMSATMPGLWLVKFKGSEKCGKVTVYFDQIVIEDQFKSRTWLIADKKLFMEAVESCN